ncbi:leucine-rich repeat-containing protein 23-like, partial [Saccoglossus kowalevskii]
REPENPLTEEIIGESLSLLCKTGNGLAHAYVKLDIHDKELSDISLLSSFIHLRYVDITQNKIRDISPLNSLTHLLTLKCDRNLLTSAKLDELPYLQTASLASNAITSTEGVNHPLLETLILSFNEITVIRGLEPSKLGRLHTLELRGNKLESTDGIHLPNLKSLFLASNTIKKLEGLERLEHLTTLHLRDNQIDKLDGFSENMKNLQYVNLRGNNISDVKETSKLKCLPLLRALVISENPCSDEDDYRMEVLIQLRRIERLDKDEYNDEERQEAEDIYEQRRLEEAQQEVEIANMEKKNSLEHVPKSTTGAEEVIHSDGEEA